MKKQLIAAALSFSVAGAFTFVACSGTQPKSSCFVQNGTSDGSPWFAKYTVQSTEGDCSFLGTHQEGGKVVTGEPMSVFLFGATKGNFTVSIKPGQLDSSDVGPGPDAGPIAIAHFNDDPTVCTATDFTRAQGVIADPNAADPSTFPQRAPRPRVTTTGSDSTGSDSSSSDSSSGTTGSDSSSSDSSSGTGSTGTTLTNVTIGSGSTTVSLTLSSSSGSDSSTTGSTGSDSASASSSDSSSSSSAAGTTGGSSSSSSASATAGSTGSTTASSSSATAGSTASSSSSGTSTAGTDSGSTSGGSTAGSDSGSTGGSDSGSTGGDSGGTSSGGAPTVVVTYQFSNVAFVQAGNVHGTQMSADLDYRHEPEDPSGGGSTCHAVIKVDAVWYAASKYAQLPDAGVADVFGAPYDDGGAEDLGFPGAHCDVDADCSSSLFQLPGANASTDDNGPWECLTMLGNNPVELQLDGGDEGAPRRCFPKSPVPVGASNE